MPMRLIIKDIAILALAWLVMIAFDLFLHAGLLARLYIRESPFLLSADEAFRRIPLGYVAFFLLGNLLLWLIEKVGIRTRRDGFIFGLQLGTLAWGALALGLYSISTAAPALLLGWWLGQALELGLAGFLFGADREGIKRGRILQWALLFLLVMVILTVVLQAAGLAPPMKTI